MSLNTPTPAAEFAWSDAFLLGFNEMDATHEEFVQVVRALLDASPEPEVLVQRMQDFIAHAERHFGEEDGWMRETEFPARDCHIDEHAAVMKSAHEVMERARIGDAHVVRSFAEELAKWFPGHADYLDSALAAWMVKRRHGARPLVLRRNVTA